MENFNNSNKVESVTKKFDNNRKPTGITPVVENGKFVTGANIFMSVRQAEFILMLSDFIETPPEQGSNGIDRNSDFEIQRVNTLFELAMVVRTMAKGVAGEPLGLTIKDISIGYGHKPSDDRY